MPTLLSSVTCHVSFGDSQREGDGATKLPIFSKSFRTRTRTRTRSFYSDTTTKHRPPPALAGC